MKQLTVKSLKGYLKDMPEDAIVYIGDDEELNGLHEAFFIQEVKDDFVSSLSYGSLTNGGVLIS